MDRIFNLDLQLLHDALFLAANVFILFLLGSFFLFNPIRNMLKKRQESIQADIDAAKKDKEEAAAIKAQYDEQMKDADIAAEQVMAEARKKALAREEAIVEEAREEASRIIARANNEVELEKAKAADNMKKEIIAVATAMAGKMVGNAIDSDVQESLVDETINEMGDQTWQS